jgi:hypothetical protein
LGLKQHLLTSGGGHLGAGHAYGQASGGSFGAISGVQQGQTQIIDISRGSSSSGGVIYKPVVKVGPAKITKSIYIHEAPGMIK